MSLSSFPAFPSAVVCEESLALEMGRASTHAGENKEGKAERIVMLSLLSC